MSIVIALPDVDAPRVWIAHAAALLADATPPEDIVWTAESETDLFAARRESPPPPRQTIDPAAHAFLASMLRHSDPARFALAYRILWRMRREPNLLAAPGDDDIHRADRMAREVGRDVHKMKAFLRFRVSGEGGEERYVAWFEPDHHIVEAAAPFFRDRFAAMRWSILTPRRCAHWDGAELRFSAGARREDAPSDDRLEAAWSAYYASTFNPARLAPRAMLRYMPKKYWRNMPETACVPQLLRTALERAADMIARAPAPRREGNCEATAQPVLSLSESDPGFVDLVALAAAQQTCARCPLCRNATQVVPGEGPRDARVMLIGEQPGDQEDLVGRPFVGPAGKLLDEALRRCGIERAGLFVTNAVKHFKFEPRGKRRLHKSPNTSEIDQCRWWLDRERALLKPQLIVTLGAAALRGVLGRSQTVSAIRGRLTPLQDGARLLATVHPSYLLRLTNEEEKRCEWRRFLDDLALIREIV